MVTIKEGGGLLLHIGMCPIRSNCYPDGGAPHPDGCHHSVCSRVDHRDGGVDLICHVGTCPIRGDGYPYGFTVHRERDRGHYSVGGRVDHRDTTRGQTENAVFVCHVDAFPIRSNGYASG